MDPEAEAEARLTWFDRFHTLQLIDKPVNTPTENTIRSHINAYLTLRKTRAEAKGNIATYDNDRQWLECFKQWVEPSAPIEAITEQLWERFYVYLTEQIKAEKYTAATAKHYHDMARAFIRNRHENKAITDLPRNLTSKDLSISVPLAHPDTFTIEEIRTFLELASPRQALYLSLALNCGFYFSDIGLLQQDEVDWRNGRIRRQRTKTREKSDKVPFVDYALWNRTFTLLKQYRSDHPEFAIVSELGTPLYDRDKRQNNAIKLSYLRLARKAKITKGWKTLRKTGATMLETGPHGRFSEHYLGEVPQTMASRHYVHQNGTEFDKAIRWLGETLGIE
jgi:integrase